MTDMKNQPPKKAELFKIFITIIIGTVIGFAMGGAVGTFEHYTHTGEALDMIQFRRDTNFFLGGFFGFLLGVYRALRG